MMTMSEPLSEEVLARLEVLATSDTDQWEAHVGAYNLFDDWSIWPIGAKGNGDRRIACWIRSKEIAELIIKSKLALPSLLAEIHRLREELSDGSKELRCYVEGVGFEYQEDKSAVWNATTAIGLLRGQIDTMREAGRRCPATC
jgi:hypothetical protein